MFDRSRRMWFCWPLPVLVLFGATFLTYTLPFKDWRFWLDSYSVAYTGQVKSVQDVKDFWGKKPHNWFNYPSNLQDTTKWSFFNALYRPLASCMPAAVMAFSGTEHQHAVFVYIMLLHALCAIALLFLFSLFLSPLSAFIGALVFAFHPGLGQWIGDFCMQPMHVNFLLIAGSIFCLKKAIDFKVVWRLILSVLLFAISVWSHEFVLLFPVWLTVAVPFYFARVKKSKTWLSCSMLALAPFYAVLFIYFAVRLATYPYSSSPDLVLFEPWNLFKVIWVRFYYGDYAAALIDVLGLRCIPHGYRITKVVLLLSVIGFSAWGMLRKSRGMGVAILLFGGLLFYWPSFALPHCLRYAYPVIPFVFGAFLYAVDDRPKLRRIARLACMLLVGLGITYNLPMMAVREEKMRRADDALRAFAKVDAGDKPLLFVGVPADWFPLGMAPGLWMYRGNDNVPIYNDYSMCTYCWDLLERDRVWQLPRADLVDVSRTGRKLRIKIKNREKAWLFGGPDGSFSMGKRVVHDQESPRFGSKAYDLTVELDSSWFRNGLKVVTWDFESYSFKVLEEIEKIK